MVDVLTKQQRSFNMSQIKRIKTKPELIIKSFLIKKGYKYQSVLFGKPDFANYKNKTAIFIDGCFWHKCPSCFVQPETNKYFWKKKINANILRDSEVSRNYESSGWKVIRIWEHDIKNQPGGFINIRLFNIP